MQTRNRLADRKKINNNNGNNSSSKVLPATEVKAKRRGNLKLDYHGLPSKERQQLLQRRERNKLAAARCRQRREDLIQSLTGEVQVSIFANLKFRPKKFVVKNFILQFGQI
jgi:hypothetical protein